MEINKLVVTNENLMGIITDEKVFLIVNNQAWNSYRMIPIKEATMNDILSTDNCIIRIAK